MTHFNNDINDDVNILKKYIHILSINKILRIFNMRQQDTQIDI